MVPEQRIADKIAISMCRDCLIETYGSIEAFRESLIAELVQSLRRTK